MKARVTIATAMLLALAAAALAGQPPAAASRPAPTPRPAPPPPPPKYTFKLGYAPGQYSLAQDMKVEQTITAAGTSTPQEQSFSQQIAAAMKIAQVDPAGNKRLEMTFQTIKYKLVSGDATVSFDSAGPPEKQSPDMLASLRPLLKATLGLNIAPDGRITAASGLGEMWDAMVKENPNLDSPVKKLRQQLTNEAVRDMMGASDRLLPTKPVMVGESWKADIQTTAPVLGPVKYDNTCTLKELRETPEGTLAVIDISGRFTVAREARTEVSGAAVTISKVDMTQSGQMLFNLTKGMFEQTSMKQSGKMQVSIAVAAGGGNRDMEVLHETEIQVRITPEAGGATTASSPTLMPAR